MTVHTKTLLFVVGTLCGIVLGEVSVSSTEVALAALALLFIQSAIIGVRSFYERKIKMMGGADGTTHHFNFPLIIILFTLGLSLGIVRSQLAEEKFPLVCESSCVFTARVTNSPEEKGEYQIFSVEAQGEERDVYDIQIKSPLYPKYHIGQTLVVSGRVTVPKNVMPHTDSKNVTSSFNYESYLHTKNIGSEMLYPHIEIVGIENESLSDVLRKQRENFVGRIHTYVSSPASEIAAGMLFGVSSVSKEILQTFRASGLSHIIVLSGFNIVIVISSILFVLGFLPLLIRTAFATLSVILFVLMVGPTPSVVRATLMALVALLALSLGRSYVAKQALILSLFAIVMYEPNSLMHDVSLHLSFLATMGLVYMSSHLEVLVKKYVSILSNRTLREIIVTTLAAYFATLPYVMYTFGKVSVYALVANVLVIPFVPLAMLLSFLSLLSSYVSETLGVMFGFMDTLLVNFMIGVARSIEVLPFSTISFSLSFPYMFLMYIIILISVKYFQVSQSNETQHTNDSGKFSEIISY